MANKNYMDIYINNTIQSPYDKRDYKFKDLVPPTGNNIPNKYFSKDLGWSYDQGSSGMCTPSAYCFLRCLQESETSQSMMVNDKFNPSFNYANRDASHNYEGLHLREVCSKGREGSVLWDIMTYPNTYAKARKEFENSKEYLLRLAKPFRVSSYYRCTSREDIQRAIMLTQGVLTSINVYDSFYKPDSKGFVNYHVGENNHGNHAIIIDGWITVNDKLYWRVKNSWGHDYGDHTGHCYIPEEYPWTESAFVIIDTISEIKIDEYKKTMNNTNTKKSFKETMKTICKTLVDYFLCRK